MRSKASARFDASSSSSALLKRSSSESSPNRHPRSRRSPPRTPSPSGSYRVRPHQSAYAPSNPPRPRRASSSSSAAPRSSSLSASSYSGPPQAPSEENTAARRVRPLAASAARRPRTPASSAPSSSETSSSSSRASSSRSRASSSSNPPLRGILVVAFERPATAEELNLGRRELLVQRHPGVLKTVYHAHADASPGDGALLGDARAGAGAPESSLAEIHAAIVHADVHGVLVVQESTDVRHGRVQQLSALVKLALLLIRRGKRAGIGEHGQVRDGAVATPATCTSCPRFMLQPATIRRRRRRARRWDCRGRDREGDVLETIADDVRVRGAPRQRAKLDVEMNLARLRVSPCCTGRAACAEVE